jgi:preprotein translocase subunit YajC
MTVSFVNNLLALAPAPTQPGQQPSAPGWTQFVPILLMVFIFYFIFIRPQQKKSREHATLMKSIRSGDKITTTSGIIGIVVSVKEKSLAIRSADTKLEILKSAVAEITERSGEAAEASSSS